MIDHLADLEADFLRFYRIDDIYQLDGPRFFRLAWRVSAYGGVMQMRLEQQTPPQPQTTPEPAARRSQPPAPGQGLPVPPGAQLVDFAAFRFNNPGIVERRKVKRGG